MPTAALPTQAAGMRPPAPAGDDDGVGHADITALLQRHRWNISHAAEALGISRNTLYRRMHRLGILAPRTK
uniref:DNA binding HTH domain-containing protein n=1 Tax=mine drainage metagenome TaxID=410659 RepID=E6PMT3_9ZZZZ